MGRDFCGETQVETGRKEEIQQNRRETGRCKGKNRREKIHEGFWKAGQADVTLSTMPVVRSDPAEHTAPSLLLIHVENAARR
jgi:hypothetical protein